MPAAVASSAVQKTQLTQEGYDEIVRELKELEEVKLPETVTRVETARGYGDLSENSEYHSAREDQELLVTRISELRTVLNNSTIVQHTKKLSAVGIGSQVTVCVKSKRSERKMVLHIVGEFEADPKSGKVSSVSPLGKALINHKSGDEVEVQVPAGVVRYEILEIK
jgi:transcription elongation factor GreA